MCGRFAITLPPEAMVQLFAAVPSNDLPTTPNFNVCPTDTIHAVTSSEGERRLQSMRWGFVPRWAKSPGEGRPLINARAETVAEKPAFRSAVERRCLIPASGYYEWTKGPEGARLPWFIHPAAGGILALAGIWQDWEREGSMIRSCAIITCAAKGDLADLHHRMPVIVEPEDWPLWLGERGAGAARLMRATDGLKAYRVGIDVNSNRAEGDHLIEPMPT